MLFLQSFVKNFKKKIAVHSFIILQILIFFFTIVIVSGNLMTAFDLNIRGLFMKQRVKTIELTNNNFVKEKNKIVLVGIDQKFFTNENVSIQGFHRGYYAKVIENINKDNPLALGIDVFFQRKYDFGSGMTDKKIDVLNKVFSAFDKQLSEVLTGNTVLATLYDFKNFKILYPDDYFTKSDVIKGHVQSAEYYKGVNLGVHPELVESQTNKAVFPLALEVYANYYLNKFNKTYGQGEISYQYEIKREDDLLSINLPGLRKSLPVSSYEGKDFIFTPIYINRAYDVPNYVSFYDVYKGNVQKDFFKDKIVYIGAVDPSLNDIKNVINGTIEGVMVHYNETLSLLADDAIYLLDQKESQILIIVFMLINFLILWVYKQNIKSHIAIFYFLIIETFIVILGGFSLALAGIWNSGLFHYSIFLPIGSLIFTITLQIISSGIYFLLTTFSSKKIFQKLFALYVGEHISEQKTSQFDEDTLSKKVAEQKRVAIFFSDIAGFTNISEKLTPQQNIDFLNEYLEKMSEVIALNNGYIDKYIGDAIMAFWQQKNNPCDLAAVSAIGNISSLNFVNANISKILNLNAKEKLINIRIGLHYGDVVVGDIGSVYKLNYTIIGDAVNLASRLEGINKYYGTKIIMSGDFWHAVENKSKFIVRKLDKITVKGKEKPIEIYELFPYFSDQLSQYDKDELLVMIDKFEKGLQAYFDKEFDFAMSYFTKANEIISDEASNIFIQRCKVLKNSTPLNWNGVWEFSQK